MTIGIVDVASCAAARSVQRWGICTNASIAAHDAQIDWQFCGITIDALLMFFYRCTWINVLAWGLAYLLAALWPQSRKAVLTAGAAGKAAYFVACAALFSTDVGRPLVLVFGLGDLLMAALFVWALLSQGCRERHGAWAAA